MNASTISNIVANLGIAVAAGYLLILQNSRVWRAFLAIIECGALCNLAGLIWLGYNTVWPGEPLVDAGFWLVLMGLCFYRVPLVTRR